MTEITEDDVLVEELAQLMAERRTGLPWKDMTEQGRDHWRDTARLVIPVVTRHMKDKLEGKGND